MMPESEAAQTICHKTINPHLEGRKCLVRGCHAWERYDWTISPCPHCGKDISSDDDEPWGECKAVYK